MVFPLLLIYSFLGTCFWTDQAALVFQAAPEPQLGWRKHIVTSWHAHRLVKVVKDGTLPDITMTRGAYPFWSASPRRRLIMGNSHFTFALDAFRNGPLPTLVSLRISCNIPTLILAPEMKVCVLVHICFTNLVGATFGSSCACLAQVVLARRRDNFIVGLLTDKHIAHALAIL